MKTKAEIKFNEIVKSCFHERLKPLKFKKKANNFYRDLGEIGQIINIQKSMFGSKENISFTVNIGIFSPIYWGSEYNFKGDSEPPAYPTEPVSIIRTRIGRFIDGKDKWWDLDQRTNVETIKSELTETLENKILPYFEKIESNDSLLKFIETEYQNYNSTYLKFVMYGELGMRDKLEQIYPILINECTKHQLGHIEERASKYGILKEHS